MQVRAALALCLVVISTSGAAPDTANNISSSQVRTLSAKADQILTKIKQTCDELHLQFGGPTTLVATTPRLNENKIGDSIMYIGPTICIDSDAHRFTFRQSDNRFTDYHNSSLIDAPAARVFYDQPVKAKWSVEQVIAIAAAFEKVFVDPQDVTLGAPFAEYYDDAEFVGPAGAATLKKYHIGQWTVCWPRVDSKGHPFYGDHVTIQIQEGCAPLGVGVYLTTPYTEEKSDPITEERALWIAEKTAFWRQLGEKIFYHCVLADEFERNVTGDQILSKQLVIVLPNRSFWGGFSEAPAGTPARLAWVFWFRPIHAKPPSGPTYNDSFAIWVDAHTGSVIGGDAML
jgi:hypothetical protein